MSQAVEYKVVNPKLLRIAITPMTWLVANQILATAKANTPHDSGDMAGAWKILRGRYRGVFVVSNDSDHARYVENGSKGHPARHVLGRAAATARARYCR